MMMIELETCVISSPSFKNNKLKNHINFNSKERSF